MNFRWVFSRTAKNRRISNFSLFKVLLLLGYISECNTNLRKKENMFFCYIDGLDFWNFSLILENRILVNWKWKLENKSRRIRRKYHQIKAWVMKENLLTAFWVFWSKIGLQCFPKQITTCMKISNFFGFFFFSISLCFLNVL